MKEASVEELFEIKQKFLRIIPHPTLIVKQLKKLEFPIESLKTLKPNFENLKSTLDLYTLQLTSLKLGIANAQSSNTLADSISKLYQTHWQLLETMAHYCPVDNLTNSVAVKLSDPFDTHDLSKFIVTEGILETEIKEYLCSDLIINAPLNCSPLLLAVLRAKKIVQNG